jgi:hypothetical protein
MAHPHSWENLGNLKQRLRVAGQASPLWRRRARVSAPNVRKHSFGLRMFFDRLYGDGIEPVCLNHAPFWTAIAAMIY